MPSTLDKSIEFAKGVGPQRADLLKKELGIYTLGDLFRHYPFRYVDRSKIHTTLDVSNTSSFIQLKGTVTNLREIGQSRGKRLVATFRDAHGKVDLVWFRGINWIKKYVQPNVEYIVFAKPSEFNGIINLVHPEMEVASNAKLVSGSGFMGVYPTTEKLKIKGLDSKGLVKIIKTNLQTLTRQDMPETLPEHFLSRYKFPSKFDAVVGLHEPQSETQLQQATKRLKFEELFSLQMRLLSKRTTRQQKFKGYPFARIDGYFKLFFEKHLPFELTEAQKRVVREIRMDTKSGKHMNRLLQGDVGSGKTIVALMCMLMAIDNGFQAALMAPTEILAQQHLESLTETTEGLGIKIALLTGSVKGVARRQIFAALEAGEIDILIGTHALIEPKVKFQNLGLVVVDEQHRFGVAQRAKLWAKNVQPPHVLVMTATPIPRTLAMTVYGDLDTSIIDELPPGRKPINTLHKYDSARLAVFGMLREEIAKGRQVYIVYPLIEESSVLDYKDLMDGFESISRAFPRPEYEVCIVHGKMKPEDKDYEMRRFAEGKAHIMVATTVIEVGVNVPNASVMIIESAERFGLSQLHQLRGRVGRGAEQSFCVLMTDVKLSKDARVRMKTMTATNDGFEIAEVDLKLRGPGDLEGTQQSVLLDLKLADIGKDNKILQEARRVAEEILKEDPRLENEEHLVLRNLLKGKKEQETWGRIS